jgi:sugar transferase (PEP-CTERM system associated)
VVWGSLLLGTLLRSLLRLSHDTDKILQFNNFLFIEGAYWKAAQFVGHQANLGVSAYGQLLAFTGIVLALSHGFDLYDSARIADKGDQIFRMLFVLGLVAIVMGCLFRYSPAANVPALVSLIVLLFAWRWIYSLLVRQPFLRERVYVLGRGAPAERLIRGLRERSDLGIDVLGWTGDVEGELTRESVASHLMAYKKDIRRVIVAMDDRRERLPVQELLELRMEGIKAEEATSWLEKIYGRIEVQQLNPSWLIFTEGFHFSPGKRLLRRVVNLSAALVGLLLALPVIPLVMLLVTSSSKGPVFYRQKRIGRGGKEFYCYKFRTMHQDAEADTGATWAADNDPRITRVGRFLRFWRLDEIPQLWCVLKGDMHFVGPRPERPEFVNWLKREIPFYEVRHMVRPGITGWAQVRYAYANTVEDSRQKLQYDLFYIKNASLSLDLWIMLQTVKIVLIGRGSNVKPLAIATQASTKLVPEVQVEQLGTHA